MRFVDSHFNFWRFSLHVQVVDLFVRGRELGDVYPVFCVDVLKAQRVVGLSLTLPILKLTIAFRHGGTT